MEVTMTNRELFEYVNNAMDALEKDEELQQKTAEKTSERAAKLEALHSAWATFNERADTASWLAMVIGIILAAILSATIMGYGFSVIALGASAVIVAVFLLMRAEMVEYDYLGFVFLVVTQLAIFWAGRTTLSSVRAGLSVGSWVIAILVLAGSVAAWRKVFERQKRRDNMHARINQLLEKGEQSNKVQETGQ